MAFYLLFLLFFIQQAVCLIPPAFQWKNIDYVWENNQTRNSAIEKGDFIPENNMPTGIARWNNKLFITIPRLKQGVPSCLNYIYLNGTQAQALNPYPNWRDAYLPEHASTASKNSTVVCAFRTCVDSCNRLWTVDNGISDLTGEAKQIAEPAVLIYDLKTDTLYHKFVLSDKVHKNTSVYTNIVVEVIPGKDKNGCTNAFAYISDMGSNALVVYSLLDNEAWRVDNPYSNDDPEAGVYQVGGIDFTWVDGISSAALSKQTGHGYRDLYFHPTSCTKQLKISTKLLRNKNTSNSEIFNGVQIIGDRGPMSQASACTFDVNNNVLFYTQLNKNGVGCWNTEKPFNAVNTPVILSDCNVMEFPSDIKMDHEGYLWMLSNRQSRFLFGTMDPNQVNYRVLTAPSSEFIRGTPCERISTLSRVFSCKSNKPSSSKKEQISRKGSAASKKSLVDSKKSSDTIKSSGSSKKNSRSKKKSK